MLLLTSIWFLFVKDQQGIGGQTVYENIKSKLDSLKEHPDVTNGINTLEIGFDTLLNEIDQALNSIQRDQQQETKIAKPKLEEPISNSFSIYNIELGDSRTEVESLAGAAKRSSYNEYGVKWFAYHENYQNFFMASFDEDDKVTGLYTNQDLLSSKQGIKIGSHMDEVLNMLGEPSTKIQKGHISYQLDHNNEYHLFDLDDSFVTVFYDKHEEDSVTAVQIISADLEQQKTAFYSAESHELKEGFEYQLFDLTNAARVVHGLPFLSWNEAVKETARDHSMDMAQNQYFNHTNLEGQSPFDRMKEDNISFRAAGENLAAGQLSSIFAHEGLMNSLGHRENILQPDFEALGVGVAFDSDSRPYYTENFLAN
ncbi:serine protease [Niallia endozanthoxylica]|uniref:Serine protease n=2 Tax=Niallia endozanthoxylica TaxID=2036016 RepID=A0A5J5HTK0_9BACI|nr:serine protease [Niallia endozanthoxylica]